MSYSDKNAISASAERGFSRSPQAQRGSARDFTQFGDREVRTNAHEPEKTDVPDFSDYNEPYTDGGGIYSRPRRKARTAGPRCRRA